MSVARTRIARGLLLASAVAIAGELGAQVPAGRYSVGAHAGYQRFRSATALEGAPFVGLDATYRLGFSPLSFLSRDSDFGIGLSFAASRPLTRGDQFPVVAFDFGDTTQLLEVPQRVTLVHYGLQAVLGVPFGRMRVYGIGGGGLYTTMFDVRQNLRNETYTAGMVQFGGGIGYAVSSTVGFRVEARDIMLLGYRRSRFDPTVGYAQDRRIRDAFGPPDATWDKPQNLQAAIVFTYVPQRTTTTAEGNQ